MATIMMTLQRSMSHQFWIPLIVQVVAIEEVLWGIVRGISCQAQGILACVFFLGKLETHLSDVGQFIKHPFLRAL